MLLTDCIRVECCLFFRQQILTAPRLSIAELERALTSNDQQPIIQQAVIRAHTVQPTVAVPTAITTTAAATTASPAAPLVSSDDVLPEITDKWQIFSIFNRRSNSWHREEQQVEHFVRGNAIYFSDSSAPSKRIRLRVGDVDLGQLLVHTKDQFEPIPQNLNQSDVSLGGDISANFGDWGISFGGQSNSRRLEGYRTNVFSIPPNKPVFLLGAFTHDELDPQHNTFLMKRPTDGRHADHFVVSYDDTDTVAKNTEDSAWWLRFGGVLTGSIGAALIVSTAWPKP